MWGRTTAEHFLAVMGGIGDLRPPTRKLSPWGLWSLAWVRILAGDLKWLLHLSGPSPLQSPASLPAVWGTRQIT